MNCFLMDLKQNGSYIVELIKKNRNSSEVSILGVIQYVSQGLSKDKYGKIIFMNQKPFEFKEIKTVPNQYLREIKEVKDLDGLKIGTEEYYKRSLHSSLCLAQYYIYNSIKESEMNKEPANWNLCKVVENLTQHAKDFGFETIQVEEI